MPAPPELAGTEAGEADASQASSDASQASSDASQASSDASQSFSGRYRYYALAILTGVYVFNFIDRQIVVILQESIKNDLGLMDWQLGMLSGFAFAVFYVTLGIPIARLADNGNRRNIIAIALAVWSAMTAMCGLVQTFWQLLLARIGVGVGEAGCSPPAHSIISDLFPRTERATALSVYNMGIHVGVFVGFLAGGWINQFFGWRVAFMVVGVPGLLFALFVRSALKEPPRGLSDGVARVADAPPLTDVFKLLWNRRSFRHLALAAGLHAFVSYGVGGWMPSFLIRSHGLETGEISNWLAPISAFGGATGAFLGGYLCDRFGIRDLRWYIWIPAIAIVVSVPFTLMVFAADDHVVGLLIYVIPVVLGSTSLGPMLAMTHALVSARMRAVASSVLFFVLNLIGLGLGPWFTGILSDVLSVSQGNEGLRYTLMIVTLVNIWCAGHYLFAARDLRSDVAKAPA